MQSPCSYKVSVLTTTMHVHVSTCCNIIAISRRNTWGSRAIGSKSLITEQMNDGISLAVENASAVGEVLVALARNLPRSEGAIVSEDPRPQLSGLSLASNGVASAPTHANDGLPEADQIFFGLRQ